MERIALFEDSRFRRGFLLGYPSSAKGRAVEKVLAGCDDSAPGGGARGDAASRGAAPGERLAGEKAAGEKESSTAKPGDSAVSVGAADAPETRPAWRLCQWATRTSLARAAPVRLPGGGIAYEDETKHVVHGGGAAGGPDLVLELRAGAEYRGRARAAGDPWPHLLVEQDSARVITLDRPQRLELEVDVRLSGFADRMDGRADPALHAAQLQLFFIVKDVSPEGPGEFLWFGVPLFDSRHEFPPPYRARDGGKDDATGKLIYTLDGREVLPRPLTIGQWISIRKDLLPSIRKALVYAAEKRFLPSGDPGRHAVVNMNLGWEMPGAFDAAAEIRGLAVTAVLPRR